LGTIAAAGEFAAGVLATDDAHLNRSPSHHLERANACGKLQFKP
jgi:hypothetical protein